MKQRTIYLSELKRLNRKNLRALDEVLFIRVNPRDGKRHGATAVIVPYPEYERMQSILFQAERFADQLSKALRTE